MTHLLTFTRLLALSLLLAMAACGTAPTAVDEKDLIGVWDAADSRQMSANLVDDVLHRSWILDFTQNNNRKPLLTLGEVSNLSSELIDTNAFGADIARELAVSTRVKFIDSAQGKRESGADYMLKVTLNYTNDKSATQAARIYQAEMTLIRLTDKRTVFTGQRQLRKALSQKAKP